jgi:DNA-directed RNA polymerase specialized sigma subunit
MSVRRIKDPAGLAPDLLELTDDGHASDVKAFRAIMTSVSPRGRLAHLRRHPQLVKIADNLERRLDAMGGRSDSRWEADIRAAEYRALYLDAAPTSIKKRARLLQTKRAAGSSAKARKEGIAERDRRICEARAEGKQLKAIAAKEGISVSAVSRAVRRNPPA